MADICACTGTNCPKKEACYRFTCVKNPYWQAYFTEVAYSEITQYCEHYWPMGEKHESV